MCLVSKLLFYVLFLNSFKGLLMCIAHIHKCIMMHCKRGEDLFVNLYYAQGSLTSFLCVYLVVTVLMLILEELKINCTR